MGNVKWIKIVVDIFDDEKIKLIEVIPDGYKIIVAWLKLLCLAGKSCSSGVLIMNDRVHFNDEMLATLFRMPLSTVRLALRTFQEFGMIEIIDDTITIPNWAKHQSIDKIEAKNEYQRKYMAGYRAKQEQIVSGSESNGKTNCKTNSETNVSPIEDRGKNKNKNITYSPSDELFEEFYKLYPKHMGKENARKSWSKIEMTDELFETIKAKVVAFSKTESWTKDGGKFVPYPATWLNQRRWEDEIETEPEVEHYPTVTVYAEKTPEEQARIEEMHELIMEAARNSFR
jgi:predicted phage replisome organizer